jgi:CheY-like chemotaxis protein
MTEDPRRSFARHLRTMETSSSLLTPRQRAAVRETCHAIGSPVAQPRRILVVDDEPLLAQTTPQLLRGHAAQGVSRLDEARQLLQAQPWDGVLWDVDLGGGLRAGVSLLHQLEQEFATVVFTRMTGHPLYLLRALDRPGAVHLEKPLTRRGLQAWANTLPYVEGSSTVSKVATP